MRKRQAHLDRLAAWELPADFPARLAEMRAPRDFTVGQQVNRPT